MHRATRISIGTQLTRFFFSPCRLDSMMALLQIISQKAPFFQGGLVRSLVS